MRNMFEEVVDLYADQVEILNQFNQVSEKKAEVLKSNNILSLNSMIRLEESLLMKLSLLENKRQKTLNSIRHEYGIKKLTKRSIKKHLNPSQIERMEILSERLQADLEKQEKLKFVNYKIVESKMEELKSILDVIDDRSSLYLPKTTLLDRKV